jgi:type I restriction enzyme M protein
MLNSELRSQVDKVWNEFWSGGMSNPLEIIEQITYLLFLKRLDDLQTLEDNKSIRLKKPVERKIFPAGKDNKSCSYEDMRWSKLKNMTPEKTFSIISENVFPFMRDLGGDGSTYSKHMEGARFTIPVPKLLTKAIDLLDQIPMEDRDTKGDLYEYMLGKLQSAGQNGQFRTPRHIIRLMVELTAPTSKDTICDPASGTCGFLVNASEYLRDTYPEMLSNKKDRDHFHNTMFSGYDFDNTMLRIGSMNMLLHGVENPDINYRDSLSQDFALEEEKYSLILANPPFAGSLDINSIAKNLLAVVKTKNTELLFLTLFLKLLKPGGRAAVIVPEGVLFKNNKANKEIRRMLVEDQKLDGVISLPSGVFKPYAGVSTAILLFTKTNSGGTDTVWFYDVEADGFSLDDHRRALLDTNKLGSNPKSILNSAEHQNNNLPDLLSRWKNREASERKRGKTEQSFTISLKEIVANDYALNLNRYKEVKHIKVNHVSPKIIISELKTLQEEIQGELKQLEGMLK